MSVYNIIQFRHVKVLLTIAIISFMSLGGRPIVPKDLGGCFRVAASFVAKGLGGCLVLVVPFELQLMTTKLVHGLL